MTEVAPNPKHVHKVKVSLSGNFTRAPLNGGNSNAIRAYTEEEWINRVAPDVALALAEAKRARKYGDLEGDPETRKTKLENSAQKILGHLNAFKDKALEPRFGERHVNAERVDMCLLYGYQMQELRPNSILRPPRNTFTNTLTQQ